jgi:hypothetical protein
MTNATRQTDLFAVQPGLFDALPPKPVEPSPDRIRRTLNELLATAQAAERMPWDAQRAEVNAIRFHQMANWLPQEERDSMRAAFVRELDRLRSTG